MREARMIETTWRWPQIDAQYRQLFRFQKIICVILAANFRYICFLTIWRLLMSFRLTSRNINKFIKTFFFVLHVCHDKSNKIFFSGRRKWSLIKKKRNREYLFQFMQPRDQWFKNIYIVNAILMANLVIPIAHSIHPLYINQFNSCDSKAKTNVMRTIKTCSCFWGSVLPKCR